MSRARTVSRRRVFRAVLSAVLIVAAASLFVALSAEDPQAQWLIVGAAAIALFGVALQFRQPGLRRIADAWAKVGLDGIGTAPPLSRWHLRRLPPDERNAASYIADQPASAFATAFRGLAARVAVAARSRSRVVAVAAVAPSEGATLTAMSLAQTLGLRGVRTLVIDCDLRGRELTRDLNLDPRIGVAEVVAAGEPWRAAVVSGIGRGFDVLPAADSNRVRDLYSQARFPAVLTELRRNYDFIVLDCPPILGSVEGRMLAREADGAILIARWVRTPVHAIKAAVDRLQRIGASRVVGLFLTDAPQVSQR